MPLRRRFRRHCSFSPGAAYDSGTALPGIHRPRRDGQGAAADGFTGKVRQIWIHIGRGLDVAGAWRAAVGQRFVLAFISLNSN